MPIAEPVLVVVMLNMKLALPLTWVGDISALNCGLKVTVNATVLFALGVAFWKQSTRNVPCFGGTNGHVRVMLNRSDELLWKVLAVVVKFTECVPDEYVPLNQLLSKGTFAWLTYVKPVGSVMKVLFMKSLELPVEVTLIAYLTSLGRVVTVGDMEAVWVGELGLPVAIGT